MKQINLPGMITDVEDEERERKVGKESAEPRSRTAFSAPSLPLLSFVDGHRAYNGCKVIS